MGHGLLDAKKAASCDITITWQEQALSFNYHTLLLHLTQDETPTNAFLFARV